MSDHADSSATFPERPNLRYLKLQAKRRLAAGEFTTLHDAQLAIAREHGLSSWTALKQFVESQTQAETAADGPALHQLRWLFARFDQADTEGWREPDPEELAEHLESPTLNNLTPQRLTAQLRPLAARLRQNLEVLENTPTHALARFGGFQVQAAVRREEPHRLVALRIFRAGPATDPRAADPTTTVTGPAPDTAVDLAERSFEELGLVGLALAGRQPDSPVWTLTRGWAGLDEPELLQPSHRFPVGGLTTLITSTAVLRLVADGRVDLDGPANERLRTLRLADDAVTVRELLSHTAGLASVEPGFADVTPTLTELTGEVIPVDRPRGQFHRSNLGYAVLGQLLADVTSLSYVDSITRLVFAPLGMTASFFPTSWPAGEPETITGYNVDDNGAFTPAPREVSTILAESGLWSSLADLTAFATGWSTLLPDDLATAALSPQAMRTGGGSVGLGWPINSAGKIAGHASVTPNSSVSLVVRLADRRTHLALTNRRVPIEPVNGRILRATD